MSTFFHGDSYRNNHFWVYPKENDVKAPWDTNDLPQLWKVEENGTMQIQPILDVESSSTINTGNLLGAMEIKIPWEILFFNSERSLQHFPNIKLLL